MNMTKAIKFFYDNFYIICLSSILVNFLIITGNINTNIFSALLNMFNIVTITVRFTILEVIKNSDEYKN